jgi:transposase
MSLKGDKKFQNESKYNRNFSEAFKREKVQDLITRRVTKSDLVRLYGMSRTTIYKWVYLYSDVEKGHKTVMQKESEQHKTQLLQSRLAELERIVGQKQLEIDYLNVCLEVASEELGYDLKKKYAPRRSNGSDCPSGGGDR